MKKLFYVLCAALLFAIVFDNAHAGVVGGPNSYMGHPMPEVDAGKLAAPAAGATAVQIKATTDLGVPNSDPGAFRTLCGLAKMTFDDPLVYPGQPGAAHLHAFFGNTGVDAFSTTASLLATGSSTCDGGIANRSSYWVPAVIDTATGAPVKPRTLLVYYKTGYNGVTAAQINLVPLGLKMIAGSAANAVDVSAANPWAFSPYYWECLDPKVGTGTQRGQQIGNCAAGTELWMHVTFPQCWDGVNLDSPDHKSHMSYPVGGACPATHPVAIPEIAYQVIYPVAATGATPAWRLSSDMYAPALPGGRSAHADYDMAWQKEVIDAAVRNCLQGKRDCHANLLGDGRILY